MKHLKQVFGGSLQQYTMALALIALIVVFNVISGGRMLTPSNFQNLISGNAYVLVLAIGMVMVIVVGHIDLSVGSVSAFVGMCVALSIRDLGFPWWLGLLLGLVVGIVVGARIGQCHRGHRDQRGRRDLGLRQHRRSMDGKIQRGWLGRLRHHCLRRGFWL